MGRGTYEIIKLDGRDATVDARDDLLGYLHGVDMVRVEAVTEPGDPGSDLVELNTLLATI